MRTESTAPRPSGTPSGPLRRARLLAVLTGLAAALALALPGPANAGTDRTFSAAQLTAASAAVRAADVPGTAWSVDGAAGSVVVQADSTVTADRIARIKRLAGENAPALRVSRIPGELTRLLSGGDPIFRPGGRCSAGFNVRNSGYFYLLTAGHCTQGNPDWTLADGTPIGPTAYSSFPDNDFGYVYYQNASIPHNSDVYLYDGTWRPITGMADAAVNMPVQRSGSTTGLRGGMVTGLNFSVNYGNGNIVNGLIRTNVCAEPGDSGGPLFTGNSAVGLTSGGSGNCTTGGVTFYQPVREAVESVGSTLP